MPPGGKCTSRSPHQHLPQGTHHIPAMMTAGKPEPSLERGTGQIVAVLQAHFWPVFPWTRANNVAAPDQRRLIAGWEAYRRARGFNPLLPRKHPNSSILPPLDTTCPFGTLWTGLWLAENQLHPAMQDKLKRHGKRAEVTITHSSH